MTVVLHQPPRPQGWDVPNMSPFCIKLETYLRMTKIPYVLGKGNPMKAPKGKIPYIEYKGELIGDSGLIIEVLNRDYKIDLDSDLSDTERSIAHAFRSLIEEATYFRGAYLRWSEAESWSFVKGLLLKILPPVIGALILKKIRKNFMAGIKAQGTGRHSLDDVKKMMKHDLKAISVFLADKKFFMGEKVTLVDATVYSFLISFSRIPWQSDIKKFINSELPNIGPYCDRMKALYWADV
ncbi:MAG: glutathione S-transferase family protein [Proteobacteria bacterium]|nr:glutathione S-transferase family protein [Pseudomonadota bacterium]